MATYCFLDDYSEGCHPLVLEALVMANQGQETAYGHDQYSQQARQMIRCQIQCPQAGIFFVSGGTLANLVMIAALLRPHEAVIAAETGHISLRETGAIEATGHKIIQLTTPNGKLSAEMIEDILLKHQHGPHMAKPRLVYISNTTEMGTLYQRQELADLAMMCRQHELLLMMDGARLPAALSAEQNDLSLSDIATYCDIFWIGGTKAGGLMGEVIIIPSAKLAEDFEFHIKQRGALLAKGRALGAQFSALFQAGLIFQIAAHSNQMAARLSQAIKAAGFSLAYPTESNQVFPIFPTSLITHLSDKYDFYVWQEHLCDRATIRLVTSWATLPEQVDRFLDQLIIWQKRE